MARLYGWDVCKCPEFPGTRIPDCQCPGHPRVSPLFQIRWKRIVADEGHTAANEDTKVTSCATSLSVERRWVVTGTPTTNLLGLSFGQNSEISAVDVLEDDVQMTTTDSESVTTSQTDGGECVEVRRTWNKHDREDLRKFAKMMIHFLGVPHFAAEPTVFFTHVVDPLFEPLGPQVGAIKVLEQVMEMQMIRHRFVL
jgi:hypothetical protein